MPSDGSSPWPSSATPSNDACAQVTYEQAGGVTYQVTRTPKSIPVTEMRTEQHKTYVPQTTTQYQSYQQTYVTPVTQYQWVARQRGQWNPFVRPYWTTELQPVTTWQASQGTVQVPTTRTDWVENNVTRQVPVVDVSDGRWTSTKLPSSAAPTGRSAERQSPAGRGTYGGTQMTSDPPRGGTSIANGVELTRSRRVECASETGRQLRGRSVRFADATFVAASRVRLRFARRRRGGGATWWRWRCSIPW